MINSRNKGSSKHFPPHRGPQSHHHWAPAPSTPSQGWRWGTLPRPPARSLPCWLQRWRNRAKSQENTGGFKKLEKARKQTLPWGLQKGASSGDILISAERPSPYSDLQNGRIIILCCFNPLGLLSQQQEKKHRVIEAGLSTILNVGCSDDCPNCSPILL